MRIFWNCEGFIWLCDVDLGVLGSIETEAFFHFRSDRNNHVFLLMVFVSQRHYLSLSIMLSAVKYAFCWIVDILYRIISVQKPLFLQAAFPTMFYKDSFSISVCIVSTCASSSISDILLTNIAFQDHKQKHENRSQNTSLIHIESHE